MFIGRYTLWLTAMLVVSCHGFVPTSNSRVAIRPRAVAFPANNNNNKISIARSKDTALMGAADYSSAAQTLFDNVISPAALLAGGLVPLGFLADPLPGNTKLRKRLRAVYWLLAVFSLANELTAVVYATVASNKLTEIASAPAASVFELIKRDYELSWIATNVHFLFGLFGFLSMIGLRAFTIFPCTLNRAAAGIAFSAVLATFSVVNRGVSAGDGAGHVHGSSILTLMGRYSILLAKQLKQSGGVMSISATVLGLVSLVMSIKAVVTCPDDNDEEEDSSSNE